VGLDEASQQIHGRRVGAPNVAMLIEPGPVGMCQPPLHDPAVAAGTEHARAGHRQAVLWALHVLEKAFAIEEEPPSRYSTITVEPGRIFDDQIQLSAAQPPLFGSSFLACAAHTYNGPDRHGAPPS